MSYDLEEVEEDSDCHVAPMSNMVARVREIVPILVEGQGSSTSLNVDHHEYQPIVPSYFDQTRDDNLRNQSDPAKDLIIHLTDNTDIIIHLPQLLCSDEITGAIPCRSIKELDELKCELANSGSGTVDKSVCELNQQVFSNSSEVESLIPEAKPNDQYDSDTKCMACNLEEQEPCNVCEDHINNSQGERPEFRHDIPKSPTCCLTENPLREFPHCHNKCGQVSDSSEDCLNQNIIHTDSTKNNDKEKCDLLVVFDNDREIKTIANDAFESIEHV